jgi:hypothetical protein
MIESTLINKLVSFCIISNYFWVGRRDAQRRIVNAAAARSVPLPYSSSRHVLPTAERFSGVLGMFSSLVCFTAACAGGRTQVPGMDRYFLDERTYLEVFPQSNSVFN